MSEILFFFPQIPQKPQSKDAETPTTHVYMLRRVHIFSTARKDITSPLKKIHSHIFWVTLIRNLASGLFPRVEAGGQEEHGGEQPGVPQQRAHLALLRHQRRARFLVRRGYSHATNIRRC